MAMGEDPEWDIEYQPFPNDPSSRAHIRKRGRTEEEARLNFRVDGSLPVGCQIVSVKPA
jgi:hypothetical protein